MVENIIFNLLAFSLFIIIFFKMVKRNDTTFVSILICEAIGIAINFIAIIFNFELHVILKTLTYVLAILIPAIVILLEVKGIFFSEIIYIALAKFFMMIGNNKVAKSLLIKLVETCKDSFKGHKMLAEIYEKEGGMRKALDEYYKAVEQSREDTISWYKIAFLLNELDKKDDAITVLNEVVKRNPEFYKGTELLGDLLCEKGDYKSALGIYINALKYNPEKYEVYYNIGIVYTMLNDFNNAKIYYQKAANINTLLYNSYYNIGQLDLIAGELDEAEKYFNQCLEDDDISPLGYYALAKIYMLKGEKEKAINFVNLSIELDSIYIKMSLEDPIFSPIKGSIRFNSIDDEDKEPRQTSFTNKEKVLFEHLESTYGIIGKLNVNICKNDNTLSEKIVNEEQVEKELE